MASQLVMLGHFSGVPQPAEVAPTYAPTVADRACATIHVSSAAFGVKFPNFRTCHSCVQPD